jgi:sortase A
VRITNVISGLVSLAMIGAGLVLIASFFYAGSQSTATNSADPRGFNVPKIESQQQNGATGGPKDKTLKLTIPKLDRIEDDTVPDASGGDEDALRRSAAIHLKGTGFPWQEEANVYIAGHRLGYPSTDSFLAFFDLDKLEKGDKIFITDSTGNIYTYEVFKNFVVQPTDVWVTEPVEGKNILTLQTCTLPNYTERVITQADLVDVAEA